MIEGCFLERNFGRWYSSTDVNVTFTNTSDEILYGAYVVCAMMDADDNSV